MFQCNALDKNDIPRVWGLGKTKKLAETNCRWELQEYLNKANARKDLRYEDFSFLIEAA